MSHVFWVSSLPEGQENEHCWQRMEKGGQRTDDMPPSSISRPHFSNSFIHRCIPGMWVVEKAFKNTPGDKKFTCVESFPTGKEKMTRKFTASLSLGLLGSPSFTCIF